MGCLLPSIIRVLGISLCGSTELVFEISEVELLNTEELEDGFEVVEEVGLIINFDTTLQAGAEKVGYTNGE